MDQTREAIEMAEEVMRRTSFHNQPVFGATLRGVLSLLRKAEGEEEKLALVSAMNMLNALQMKGAVSLSIDQAKITRGMSHLVHAELAKANRLFESCHG